MHYNIIDMADDPRSGQFAPLPTGCISPGSS